MMTCGCLPDRSTTFCMGALSVYCLPRLHPHHQAYACCEVGDDQDGEGAFHALAFFSPNRIASSRSFSVPTKPQQPPTKVAID